MGKKYPSIFLSSLTVVAGIFILLFTLGMLLNISWFFFPLFSVIGFVALCFFVFAMMAQD